MSKLSGKNFEQKKINNNSCYFLWQRLLKINLYLTLLFDFSFFSPKTTLFDNCLYVSMSRAVKILENFNLVLAWRFENFQKLPSKDSRALSSSHFHLEFLEFLRTSLESLKILEATFSQRCRNMGGNWVQPPSHILQWK